MLIALVFFLGMICGACAALLALTLCRIAALRDERDDLEREMRKPSEVIQWL